jgi:hypothetical protein
LKRGGDGAGIHHLITVVTPELFGVDSKKIGAALGNIGQGVDGPRDRHFW